MSEDTPTSVYRYCDQHDASESWRDIPGYEDLYQASDLGAIRSLPHKVPSRGGTRVSPGRVLKQHKRPDGYLQVQLYSGGEGRWFSVHSVIAAAFFGPRPKGFDVCHGDGNPANNAVVNLRYDTKSANQLDNVAMGTHAYAAATQCKNGHEWTAQNTYRPPSLGHRRCRTCRNEQRGRRKAATNA